MNRANYNEIKGHAVMGSTFGSLLELFVAARDIEYRTDPERDEGRLQIMESTVQAMLELLRDKFDRR
jgi:hypothetical protein